MSGNIEFLKGKGFDANPQNINRNGRPRKQLSIILSEVQELGYKRPSDSEIVEIMRTHALALCRGIKKDGEWGGIPYDYENNSLSPTLK